MTKFSTTTFRLGSIFWRLCKDVIFFECNVTFSTPTIQNFMYDSSFESASRNLFWNSHFRRSCLFSRKSKMETSCISREKFRVEILVFFRASTPQGGSIEPLFMKFGIVGLEKVTLQSKNHVKSIFLFIFPECFWICLLSDEMRFFLFCHNYVQ